MKIFEKLNAYFDMHLKILAEQLKAIKFESEFQNAWDLDTGRKFNEIINTHAISEEELLEISKTVAKYVTQTRITNIDCLLFYDEALTEPRSFLLEKRLAQQGVSAYQILCGKVQIREHLKIHETSTDHTTEFALRKLDEAKETLYTSVEIPEHMTGKRLQNEND